MFQILHSPKQKAVQSPSNNEKNESKDTEKETINNSQNTNNNPSSQTTTTTQYNIISVPSPPKTINNTSASSLPARHPMFDGMDYKQMDEDLSSDSEDNAVDSNPDDDDVDMSAPPANPWTVWHQQYQNYLANYNQTNPATQSTTTQSEEPSTTKTDDVSTDNADSAKFVFTTDPETGGLVQVSADSVPKSTATIAATTNVDPTNLALQQQQIQSQQLLQSAQQQLAMAIMNNANTNNYYAQSTSFSVITPTVNPYIGTTQNDANESGVHPERQSQVQTVDTIIEKSCEQVLYSLMLP